MSNPTPTPASSPPPAAPATVAVIAGPIGRQKHSQDAIERRRIGVYEMLCCGQSVDDIANSLKVSSKTVKRDIEWWHERLGYNTEQLKDPKKAAIDVGMTAKKLEKIFEDAYVEYAAATNGAFKVRFLQTAAQAAIYRHKILADAGYLPKVGHEKERPTKVEINFTQRFGPEAEVFEKDPKSRRRVLEAFQAYVKERALSDKDVLGLPLTDARGGNTVVPAIDVDVEVDDLVDPSGD